MNQAYTFNDREVSDLYKFAFGVRPTMTFWNVWDDASDDEKQEIWNSMEDSLQFNEEPELLDLDFWPCGVCATFFKKHNMQNFYNSADELEIVEWLEEERRYWQDQAQAWPESFADLQDMADDLGWEVAPWLPYRKVSGLRILDSWIL